MKLVQRPGNIYKSPAHPIKASKPSGDAHAKSARPSWDFDSEENDVSWRGIFQDIARECKEFIKRRTDGSKSPNPTDSTDDVLWVAGGPASPERHTSPTASPLKGGMPFKEHTGAPEVSYGVPVDAWVSELEDGGYVARLKFENGSVRRAALRKLGARWRTLCAPDSFWTAWRAHTDTMKALGFNAVKIDGGKRGVRWQLEFNGGIR